ncbi:hypothetical protein PLIIFM63780_002102 [Purpureocillium lilacinum]|nr:hypothetical protein PLIIFM63780_002102 [Purpureocillium lilacinum]
MSVGKTPQDEVMSETVECSWETLMSDSDDDQDTEQSDKDRSDEDQDCEPSDTKEKHLDQNTYGEKDSASDGHASRVTELVFGLYLALCTQPFVDGQPQETALVI